LILYEEVRSSSPIRSARPSHLADVRGGIPASVRGALNEQPAQAAAASGHAVKPLLRLIRE
jgi:hypothetical protein